MFKIILPSFTLNIEKWKYNKEFKIFVSNKGKFKSKEKENLPIKINKSGYIMVDTPVGIKAAHRLVMLTWKPIPNAEDLTVDHLDHNKRDNSVENLEWVTKEENVQRAIDDKVDRLDRQPIIINSNKIFKDIDAAADYMIKRRKIQNNEQVKSSVRANIINAINKKEKYAGEIWIKVCI